MWRCVLSVALLFAATANAQACSDWGTIRRSYCTIVGIQCHPQHQDADMGAIYAGIDAADRWYYRGMTSDCRPRFENTAVSATVRYMYHSPRANGYLLTATAPQLTSAEPWVGNNHQVRINTGSASDPAGGAASRVWTGARLYCGHDTGAAAPGCSSHSRGYGGGWNGQVYYWCDNNGAVTVACTRTMAPPPPPSAFTFHAGPATWAEARADCRSRGGDIASILSASENAEAAALANRRDTWFGFHDRQVEGQWQWSDGSAVGYTNWSPGEPNSYEGDEDCALFWSGGAYGAWYDGYGSANCNGRIAYLCRNSSPRPPSPPPPPHVPCPNGWMPQAGSNKCNKFVGTGTQAACESACANALPGASSGLACVENQAELDFLATFTNVQRSCCQWSPTQDFSCCAWVGLYQQSTADMGSTGSPSAGWGWRTPSCTSTFRPWSPGEPNQYSGTEEDCAMLGAWGSRQLNDYVCGGNYRCLCETTPSPPPPAFPLPSPPPPSPPPPAEFRLEVTLVASESIEVFTDARKATLLNEIIVLSGLNSAVLEEGATIHVTPGSVSIRAVLPVADGSELSSAFESLSSGLASTEAASSALGLTITSLPTLMAAAPAGTPNLNPNLLNTNVVAGQSTSLTAASIPLPTIIGITASVVVVACVCLLLWRRQKKQAATGRFHTHATRDGRDMTVAQSSMAFAPPLREQELNNLPTGGIAATSSAPNAVPVVGMAVQRPQEYDLSNSGHKVPMTANTLFQSEALQAGENVDPFCSNCGKRNERKGAFCTGCGASLSIQTI